MDFAVDFMGRVFPLCDERGKRGTVHGGFCRPARLGRDIAERTLANCSARRAPHIALFRMAMLAQLEPADLRATG